MDLLQAGSVDLLLYHRGSGQRGVRQAVLGGFVWSSPAAEDPLKSLSTVLFPVDSSCRRAASIQDACGGVPASSQPPGQRAIVEAFELLQRSSLRYFRPKWFVPGGDCTGYDGRLQRLGGKGGLDCILHFYARSST